jgi:hypothetical protein
LKGFLSAVAVLLALSFHPLASLQHANAGPALPQSQQSKNQAAGSASTPEAKADANPDPKELIARSARDELQNEKVARTYTFIQREETHKLDSSGKVISSESETSEVMILYDEPVERVIARNDQPLSAKDAAKQEAKIDKFMRDRKNETPDDRQKRLDKEEKEREEGRAFVSEVSQAYNFTLMGTQSIEGRDAYQIDAQPRPEYKPQSRAAKLLLPKFKFRVWIDKQDSQWVKMDAEAVDNATWGLFLVKLYKGSTASLEQTRVNDEVWLPKRIHAHVKARVALFKGIDEDIDITYKDYKKFRTEIKLGPAQPVTQ